MHMTPRQCLLARTYLDLTREQLATATRVSRSTVARFEDGETAMHPNNYRAVRAFFTEQGIEFVDERTMRFPQAGSDVLMRERKPRRPRGEK